MNDEMATALVLAVGLIVLGAVTGYFQLRGLRRLAADRYVPSDEQAYFRGRYRRRLLTAAVLVVLGGLIGGAYLSGMERNIDEMKREPAIAPEGAAADQPRMTDDQKFALRVWGGYWIVVLVGVFLLVALALADAWATRRYWLAQYRALREDHQTRLRRDLAVYRQHKEQSRGGRFGNRLGEAGGDEPPAD